MESRPPGVQRKCSRRSRLSVIVCAGRRIQSNQRGVSMSATQGNLTFRPFFVGRCSHRVAQMCVEHMGTVLRERRHILQAYTQLTS